MSDKKYCIQLSECEGNSKDVYSYDEIEIGTWVDSKPIYRKVITKTLAKGSGASLVFANVSELMIDRVINLSGNMIGYNDTFHITLQTSYDAPTGLKSAVNMYYNYKTGDILYHFLDSLEIYAGKTANVIMEYTKK